MRFAHAFLCLLCFFLSQMKSENPYGARNSEYDGPQHVTNYQWAWLEARIMTKTWVWKKWPFCIFLPNFNKMPQNSKTHNLLIPLSFDTNEYNLEMYWKDLQYLSLEFLQINPLRFPKFGLKFTNFEKWPIIL